MVAWRAFCLLTGIFLLGSSGTSAQAPAPRSAAAGGDVRRGPMTSAQADTYLAGSDALPGGNRLRRVLVADAVRLSDYVRGRDALLAYHAMREAEIRGDEDLSAALVARLRDTADTDLSAQAARTLAKIGGKTAITALQRAQRDERALVRTEVRAALSVLSPQLLEEARRKAAIVERENRSPAAIAERRRSRYTTENVRRYLLSSGGYSLPPSVRNAAAQKLFRETLQTGKTSVLRAHAAHALGLLHDVADVPVLARALQDRAAYVRVAAAWGLANIGSAQAIPALQRAITETAPDAAASPIRGAQAQNAAEEAVRLIRRAKFPPANWTDWPRH